MVPFLFGLLQNQFIIVTSRGHLAGLLFYVFIYWNSLMQVSTIHRPLLSESLFFGFAGLQGPSVPQETGAVCRHRQLIQIVSWLFPLRCCTDSTQKCMLLSYTHFSLFFPFLPQFLLLFFLRKLWVLWDPLRITNVRNICYIPVSTTLSPAGRVCRLERHVSARMCLLQFRTLVTIILSCAEIYCPS